MKHKFISSIFTLLKKFLSLTVVILAGNQLPPIPNVREDRKGKLMFPGLVRGTFVIGKPGSGKTRFLAALVMTYAQAFPDQGAVILDASGSLCNDILAILLRLPPAERERVQKRLVVDLLNHPEYTQTQPEFHADYGVPMEKQIQRVAENLRRLNLPVLELGMLGKPAFEELAPELFRLLSVIRNEHGETWQLTESKKLLMDDAQRSLALAKFGAQAPEADWYFRQYTKSAVEPKEWEMRSFTLRSALGVIEPRSIRARVGYYRPTWTPKEAVKKGLIVLVSGELMLDEELQLNYLFTQIYSLLRQEMNQRKPNDPNDKPFLLAIDEAPITFKVPGLAQEIGEISTFYRNRKVWLIVVVQALWQLAKELEAQIWSLGNIVAFAVEDIEDAKTLAEQLFHYAPRMVKQEPRTDTQNPTTEPHMGQTMLHANWLQSFKQRECVLRRYYSESARDPYIRHIAKIPDVPSAESLEEVEEIKEKIFKERAIPVRDALEIINQRSLTVEKNEMRPRQQPARDG